MGAARGIARGTAPEGEGVFLCRDEFEAGFFVSMYNTGPVDVWAVAGIGEDELITGDAGVCYFPAPIPPAQVRPADWPHDELVITAHREQQGNKQRKKPRAGM